MEILIATNNPGKAREFREMLSGEHRTWKDLGSLPRGEEIPETGLTFRANACLKAAAYAKRYHTWALADDSGLEVDALQGQPGVLSARWASLHNAGSGDAANNALLLQQLANVPDKNRTARFVCVLALSDPQGRILLTARGHVEGMIQHEPRGNNGFGYDPLFLVAQLGKTTAELDPGLKHAISHRGTALRRLRGLLERVGDLPT